MPILSVFSTGMETSVPLGFENQGIFHEGTRFVSRWKLEINGVSPLLLSSNVREDNDFLVVDLANPPLITAEDKAISQGTVHLVRTSFLWEGDCFERIEISNFALKPIAICLEISFGADYVDLFEIRGTPRVRHGKTRNPIVEKNQVTLAYEGIDGVMRHTRFRFAAPPEEISAGRAVFRIELQPQEEKRIDSRMSFFAEEKTLHVVDFDKAFARMQAAYENYRGGMPALETSNPQFNDWINQSRADLHLLLTRTEEGLYPYAGIPWV